MPHRTPPSPTAAQEDEFDMYGVQMPLGGWTYALDDTPVVYGSGWYPFHRHVQRTEPHPAAPLLTRSASTGRTVPTSVRISPDTEFRSWRNEYTVLRPYDHRVHAHLTLFVEPRGAGAMIRRVTAEIDLRASRVTVPAQCPVHLREQAEVKAQRAMALLLAARAERRHGRPAPAAVLHPGLRHRSPRYPDTVEAPRLAAAATTQETW
ncbi:hypothetical protein [Streptomyces sp. NPDC047981]|uniref:hypothetical protein n=1 Tax=Streptomyces sp. NPDC047981 TaxID=3154610 RepID=UPI00342E1531